MADDWEALIQQVKEASDIVDVVGGYVALRQVGPTFKGLCPFHDDHNPSMDVSPVRQRFVCWACGKKGDVLTFIQEHDRVNFREALELLARRAGISLEKTRGFRQHADRAGMLDLMRWSCEQFHQCLLGAPMAEAARRYLGERRFTDATIRRYGLGYAPNDYTWLVQRANQAGHAPELLEKLGLIAQRSEGHGHFDRFRDRIIFPIRDARGQTIAFGGRILPTSPAAEKAPKYYNSAETPLFAKREHLYGLDQARPAAIEAGYLAVVEGYTDVLIAHQLGVLPVVSTMGTALTDRHVHHLRRFVPKVILVFDADAGGDTGVDRALEIFASQDVELAVATLPGGMDPFDLLVAEGPEPFRQALAAAVDALTFKLQRVLAGSDGSIESQRRAIDAVLGVLALAPDLPDQAGAIKRDLMITRIAQQLHVEELVIRKRLGELRAAARERERKPAVGGPAAALPADREAPAAAHERQLLQVLLAEPGLIAEAAAEVAPAQIEHPGLRRLLEGLYALHAEGGPIDIDRLRARVDHPRLAETALKFQDLGRKHPERSAWLQALLAEFKKRRNEPILRELQNRLRAATDHSEARQLLEDLEKARH